MAAHDPRTKPVSGRILRALLLMSMTALAGASGAAGMARVAAMGPRVGDIIAFDLALPSQAESGTRLAVARPDQKNCVLDIDTIRRSGGSLVMERRVTGPTRLYRAHWAGPRTSEAVTDCGGDADLVLTPLDVSTLAAAAGGFGAARLPGPPLK